MKLRLAARGLVRDGDRVLVVEYRDSRGEAFYAVPGGAVTPGEPLSEVVRRECLEETGAQVQVGDALFVCEFTVGPDPLWDPNEAIHQVEIHFDCRVTGGGQPEPGRHPDQGQTGVRWMSVAELRKVRFYPAKALELIDSPVGDRPVYLGVTD
ncbi:MAG: hypothetical protein BIFFINMI_01643 [Phycisphaerae bacterium]|nr:hypothetical protein [Phycisphaerae bacterium]